MGRVKSAATGRGEAKMTRTIDQDRLLETLREALDAAERLGFGVIACHIDHALALAAERSVQRAPLVWAPGTISVM
jgi:hypothetical protein